MACATSLIDLLRKKQTTLAQLFFNDMTLDGIPSEFRLVLYAHSILAPARTSELISNVSMSYGGVFVK